MAVGARRAPGYPGGALRSLLVAPPDNAWHYRPPGALALGHARAAVARRGEVTSGHATSRSARTVSWSRARSCRLSFRRASSSRRALDITSYVILARGLSLWLLASTRPRTDCMVGRRRGDERDGGRLRFCARCTGEVGAASAGEDDAGVTALAGRAARGDGRMVAEALLEDEGLGVFVFFRSLRQPGVRQRAGQNVALSHAWQASAHVLRRSVGGPLASWWPPPSPRPCR